jgi:hypothetical protein
LHLAIHAHAHALFGREKRLQKATDQAAIFYRQSIARLQEEMLEYPGQKIDAGLITRMLLGAYEVTSYRCSPALFPATFLTVT